MIDDGKLGEVPRYNLRKKKWTISKLTQTLTTVFQKQKVFEKKLHTIDYLVSIKISMRVLIALGKQILVSSKSGVVFMQVDGSKKAV